MREVQAALERLGIATGGPADGRFGVATRSAVQDFQTRNGLRADGVVGQDTVNAILAKANATGGATIAAGPAPTQPAGALDPSERLQALDALGNILRSRKLYAEAVDVYNRAIAMIPKPDRRHWFYFYARGTSYERF